MAAANETCWTLITVHSLKKKKLWLKSCDPVWLLWNLIGPDLVSTLSVWAEVFALKVLILWIKWWFVKFHNTITKTNALSDYLFSLLCGPFYLPPDHVWEISVWHMMSKTTCWATLILIIWRSCEDGVSTLNNIQVKAYLQSHLYKNSSGQLLDP